MVITPVLMPETSENKQTAEESHKDNKKLKLSKYNKLVFTNNIINKFQMKLNCKLNFNS